ncbi:MAG: DNA mismatch repair protein MutS [Acidobacteriota bacterium]|nr:DNA mismatch repair protein MutS [Acidobacteriota bacterium]
MTEYARRLEARTTALHRAEQLHRCIGNIRLLIFLAAVILAWLRPGLWLLLPVLAFIALVIYHRRVLRARDTARRSIAFYERGIDRLEDRWAGKGEPGNKFSDPAHSYAEDLDLFGKGSLFELLCTARTRVGEATLARWLLAPSSREEVSARQRAVEELRARIDLREDLAQAGENFRSGVHPEELAAWGAAPAIHFPRAARVLALTFAITAFGLLIAFVVTLFVDPRVRIALVSTGLLEGIFALRFRADVARVALAVERPGRDLALLAQVLQRLERERFTSPRLAELRAALEVEGLPASTRIARLNHLIELLDSRDNVFLRVFGPLLLWTTQTAFAIESWRRSSGPSVAGWLQAVGEIEALSALAGYAWEHPQDPYPTFSDDGPAFQAEGLAHPLLPESRCVRNDVDLNPTRRLLIVSGSNMSGKSTLLRTVGVNVVLAMAGAPVRAGRLALSPLCLGASIRVTDSLQGASSRFYAEITRLRQILDLTRGPRPVLFLLDELLHGTNSHDRRIGAEAVVRSLLTRGAIGLITTHDLALADIALSLAPPAANVHFEDRLEDGRITFDYLMRPGVVTKSNALELMRAVGLEV